MLDFGLSSSRLSLGHRLSLLGSNCDCENEDRSQKSVTAPQLGSPFTPDLMTSSPWKVDNNSQTGTISPNPSWNKNSGIRRDFLALSIFSRKQRFFCASFGAVGKLHPRLSSSFLLIIGVSGYCSPDLIPIQILRSLLSDRRLFPPSPRLPLDLLFL